MCFIMHSCTGVEGYPVIRIDILIAACELPGLSFHNSSKVIVCTFLFILGVYLNIEVGIVLTAFLSFPLVKGIKLSYNPLPVRKPI